MRDVSQWRCEVGMKIGLKVPPVWKGWTNHINRHMGTNIPPTPTGTTPGLVKGKPAKPKVPAPYYNVPEVPGKAHGK